MKPRISVGTARSPDGQRLELIEHDGDYVLMADDSVLMSTRVRHSEEILARLGCEGLGPTPRVLIGGLGMGFTLRAALDVLPGDASVVQAELIPEVVAWNRGPLGECAGRPLDDPRTEIVIEDVGAVIRRMEGRFDAILLDVDNGPSALVSRDNARLYSDNGLRAAHRSLRPNGRLAIWSADNDERFPRKLEGHGFTAAVHRVAGSRAGGSPRHVVFTGRRV